MCQLCPLRQCHNRICNTTALRIPLTGGISSDSQHTAVNQFGGAISSIHIWQRTRCLPDVICTIDNGRELHGVDARSGSAIVQSPRASKRLARKCCSLCMRFMIGTITDGTFAWIVSIVVL